MKPRVPGRESPRSPALLQGPFPGLITLLVCDWWVPASPQFTRHTAHCTCLAERRGNRIRVLTKSLFIQTTPEGAGS